MSTKIIEIAYGIYRISTHVPDLAPPAGFTFNQFLIVGDDTLLFHTDPSKMFPLTRAAVAKAAPPQNPPLDHIRPFRGRRVWRHERMARGRAAGRTCPWPDRNDGLDQ